jgi:hypothetical protein
MQHEKMLIMAVPRFSLVQISQAAARGSLADMLKSWCSKTLEL